MHMQDIQYDYPNGTLENHAYSSMASMAMPHVGLATASDVDIERPHLLALARRLALNAYDADDLVQDAMVRALPALGKVAIGSHLRAWLLTILRRMHIDQRRRAARAPEAVSIEDVRDDALASDGATAPAAADRETADDINDVRAALRGLPEAFRQVLVLHEFEGRSYREIAQVLDLPLSTVGTRLSRGRLKLRDLVAAERMARAG
jgi:RNA polymerase sigma-70 factor (ECF subfamily)